MTLEAQIAEFASLGAVHDPVGTDAAVAEEIAQALLGSALVGGPLERIGRLTKLAGILKLAAKIVTAQRDLVAYSATAIWPYRRLAKLASVTPSTMQGWINTGRKAVEPQQVPRGTDGANSVENANSNREPIAIR